MLTIHICTKVHLPNLNEVCVSYSQIRTEVIWHQQIDRIRKHKHKHAHGAYTHTHTLIPTPSSVLWWTNSKYLKCRLITTKIGVRGEWKVRNVHLITSHQLSSHRLCYRIASSAILSSRYVYVCSAQYTHCNTDGVTMRNGSEPTKNSNATTKKRN